MDLPMHKIVSSCNIYLLASGMRSQVLLLWIHICDLSEFGSCTLRDAHKEAFL